MINRLITSIKSGFFVALATACLSVPLHAKEIKAAVGTSLSPYIIQQTNAGIELDIVREALAYKGHTLTLRYPALRLISALFNNNVVDAALTVNKTLGLNACLSDVAITYQNYAITLQRSQQTIHSLNDLQGKKVVAFQNATLYLGEDFAKAVSTAQYREVQQQTLQVNRLYMGRDDIVIADKNIFLYYRARVKNIDTSAPLAFWPLFPPSPYRVAFRDKGICDDFNQGLAHLKNTGRYTDIIRQYQHATESP